MLCKFKSINVGLKKLFNIVSREFLISWNMIVIFV